MQFDIKVRSDLYRQILLQNERRSVASFVSVLVQKKVCFANVENAKA